MPMIERISEDELEFMECFNDPVCLDECLFSNLNNLTQFDDTMSEIRLYQYPFLSFESTVDVEGMSHSLAERMDLKKNLGEMYLYGGRLFGKTCISMILDFINSCLLNENEKCAYASIDQKHITDDLEPVKEVFDNHPICRAWKRRKTTTKNNIYRFILKNGFTCSSVNFALSSNNPGKDFFGLHYDRLYIDEESMETQEVYDKRKDSQSEQGAVLRIASMTNFTRYSPAGQIFYKIKNKDYIINLPQYVNPTFTVEKEKEKAEEYGGKESILYKIFVEGSVIEDGIAAVDMERVKKCYLEKKEIKRIELTKERYELYTSFLIVERPTNASKIYLCSDIGDGGAGSNIIIIAEIEGFLYWIYDIILYKLTDDEQSKIFDYLIQQLNADVIGLDCGDGTGRAIATELEKNVSYLHRIIRYNGNTKVNVGFEKEDSGNVKILNGKPVVKEEFMSEWSVKVLLEQLFYNQKIYVPEDIKFDDQFNSVIATKSGNRMCYASTSKTGDHLWDAFKVFAIAWYLKKDCKTEQLSKPLGFGIAF